MYLFQNDSWNKNILSTQNGRILILLKTRVFKRELKKHPAFFVCVKLIYDSRDKTVLHSEINII